LCVATLFAFFLTVRCTEFPSYCPSRPETATELDSSNDSEAIALDGGSAGGDGGVASQEEASVEKSSCTPHEERPFDSEVHIAALEFARVETIFIILVFIIVVVLAKMGKRVWLLKTRFCCSRQYTLGHQ